IVAASSPGDCFTMVQEAVRIAVEFMTPCFFLSDGYLANGSEPWRIPKFSDLPPIVIKHPEGLIETNGSANGNGHAHHEADADSEGGNGHGKFMPYLRDARLVRPWAIPGTPGLQHRIGGIEKRDGTGNIDYAPSNHQHMTNVRKQKVANIAQTIPLQDVLGPEKGKLLVLSWGGTYGAVRGAVE